VKREENHTGSAQPALKMFTYPVKKRKIPGKVKIMGNVEHLKNFYSHNLNNKRDLIVWLPPSYNEDAARRYPVLYMHDGQNIMNPKTSFSGTDWRVDETLTKLIKEDKIEEVIVIGIYNTHDRLEEYSDSEKGKKYIKFIIEELKPFVDLRYRTLRDRKNTAAMGSSMGGLISFFMVWNHQDVFCKAGCLSSSFYYNSDKAIEMVIKHSGQKKKIKIYIDHGEDGLLKGQKMFSELTAKGYVVGKDIDYYYEPGAGHNENAWAKRLERPLFFLFKK
jgi:predicted alpha/beta superfamily hydrolase